MGTHPRAVLITFLNNFRLSVESNPILRRFSFTSLPRSLIGPKELRHSLNQSDAKLQPITTWRPSFPEEVWMVFYFEFSLAHKCISFLLIGCGDNFRFGITTLNRKALHNFSGPTSFYQDKSKPYYNPLNVIVDISPP